MKTIKHFLLLALMLFGAAGASWAGFNPPKKYTGPVSIYDLVDGDTLAPGFSLTYGHGQSEIIYFANGRYSTNGTPLAVPYNVDLIDPELQGTSFTAGNIIFHYAQDGIDTLAPMVNMNTPGNAWVVSNFNRDAEGVELYLSGIEIVIDYPVQDAAGNWSFIMPGYNVALNIQYYDSIVLGPNVNYVTADPVIPPANRHTRGDSTILYYDHTNLNNITFAAVNPTGKVFSDWADITDQTDPVRSDAMREILAADIVNGNRYIANFSDLYTLTLNATDGGTLTLDGYTPGFNGWTINVSNIGATDGSEAWKTENYQISSVSLLAADNSVVGSGNLNAASGTIQIEASATPAKVSFNYSWYNNQENATYGGTIVSSLDAVSGQELFGEGMLLTVTVNFTCTASDTPEVLPYGVTANADGSFNVMEGVELGVTATPDSAHYLSAINGHDTAANAATGYTFTMPSANHTLAANFTQKPVLTLAHNEGGALEAIVPQGEPVKLTTIIPTATALSTGSQTNDTVTVTVAGQLVWGNGGWQPAYGDGNQGSVTVTAAAGFDIAYYKFYFSNGNSYIVSGETAAVYPYCEGSMYMIYPKPNGQGNHIGRDAVTRIEVYTPYRPNIIAAATPNTYIIEYGTDVTVKATPDSVHYLANFDGTDVRNDNDTATKVYTNVTDNFTATANFAAKPTLTLASNNSDWGRVCVETGNNVSSGVETVSTHDMSHTYTGENFTVTCNHPDPDDGFYVSANDHGTIEVLGCKTISSVEVQSGYGDIQNLAASAGNISFSGSWATISNVNATSLVLGHTDANTNTLQIYTVKVHYQTSLPDNVNVGTAANTYVVDYGTDVTVIATANDGYHMDSWSNGATVNDLVTNNQTITVTTDSTITANFAQNPLLTLASNQGGEVTLDEMGIDPVSVTAGTEANTYRVLPGTELSAIATANDGFHIASWSNNDEVTHILSDITAPFTVTEDLTLEATFAPNPVLTIASNNSEWGTVTLDGTVESPIVYDSIVSINDADVTVPEGKHFLVTGNGSVSRNKIVVNGGTLSLGGVKMKATSGGNSIYCTGNATIILPYGTTNTVTFTGSKSGAAIELADGTTLTIKGSGTLNATGNGNSPAIGTRRDDCADIFIEGGIINATGGQYAAAIGGAIYSSCGNVTIANTVTRVKAVKGSSAPYSIGAGLSGSFGNVTIGGNTGAISQSPYTYNGNASQQTAIAEGVIDNHDGTYTVLPGTEVALSARATTLHHVADWKDENQNSLDQASYRNYFITSPDSLFPERSQLSFTVTGDTTAMVMFGINSYNVTALASRDTRDTIGTNLPMGNVSASYTAVGGDAMTAGTADSIYYTAEGGTSTTLTATANYGYLFAGWNVSPNAQATVKSLAEPLTDNPLTVSPTVDVTYTALFVPDTFSFSTGTNRARWGVVAATENGRYPYRTIVTMEAQPTVGNHFVVWSDGDSNIARSFNLTQDSALMATFARDEYRVAFFPNDDQRGYISSSHANPFYCNYLYTTHLKANAYEGYHFVQWTDSANTVIISTSDSLDIVIMKDTTLFAHFEPNAYNLFVSTADTNMGTVSGSGSYDFGTSATISAAAKYGYHFDRWSDGVTDPQRTIAINFTHDSSLTAIFALNQYAVTVESSDPQRGSVSGSATVDYLTQLQISATANEHYHFTGWNDNSTANPRTVTVTGNMSFTASFAPDQYTVSGTAAQGMGSVEGSATVDYLTTVTLTAVPACGFVFDHWSDNAGADNIYSGTLVITATEDISLTAFFRATNVDTVFVHDTTVIALETIYVNVPDTVLVPVTVYDTTHVPVVIYDTTCTNSIADLLNGTANTVTVFDTIHLLVRDDNMDALLDGQLTMPRDTVFIHDTVYLHDTIFYGLNNYYELNAKVYVHNHQIVVEGADGNQVVLYDLTGRKLAVKQDNYDKLYFDVPVSGSYLIKIGEYQARKVAVIK